jgi:hypothetical protein
LAAALPRDSLSREQDLKYARGHKNRDRGTAEAKVMLIKDRGNYPAIGLRSFAAFKDFHASSCLV